MNERRRSIRCIRYVLQISSLVLFVFLLHSLAYPLGWQAQALQWFTRLDPWALLSHLRWQHSVPAWGWLPVLTMAAALVFGRVFCGWLCPFGALMALVDRLILMLLGTRSRRLALARTELTDRLQPVKYYWLLLLAVVFALGAGLVLRLTPFMLFSHEIIRVLREAVPWALIAIVTLTLLFSRLWCSVLCPTGLLLSLAARPRLLRYQVLGDCVHCGRCAQTCPVGAAPEEDGAAGDGCLACGECQSVCPTRAVSLLRTSELDQRNGGDPGSFDTGTERRHTRRQFLGIAITAVICVAAIAARITLRPTRRVLRPPGALPAAEFASVCTRCGRCVKVCPNNALQPMSIAEGLEHYGTPQIIPRYSNCSLCLTCQEVCPTGAIAKVPLEQAKMGTAVLDQTRCLAWSEDKLCFVCGEQCPLVVIDGDDRHRPTVQTDRCVGCGTCERSCPVIGEAAIRVQPR
jgi:ferredoxin-type protein NapH